MQAGRQRGALRVRAVISAVSMCLVMATTTVAGSSPAGVVAQSASGVRQPGPSTPAADGRSFAAGAPNVRPGYPPPVDTTNVSGTSILNEDAILAQNKLHDPQWFKDNIPFFDSPDSNINGVYYYRWDSARQHLRYTLPGSGYISTEFVHPAPYSNSLFGAVSAAAGLQIGEARWLRDQRYMNDFETYWLRGGGTGGVRQYSFWIADAFYQRYLVNGDPAVLKRLLPDLIKNYNAWSDHYDASPGLYAQYPVWDASEFTDSSYHSCDSYHGGAGYRPTLNSYMYGDAVAISNVAALAGDTATAADFAARAATLRSTVQQTLWDPVHHFFMQLFTGDARSYPPYDEPANCNDAQGWSGKLAPWREEMGFVPWQFNLPDPRNAQYAAAWQYLMDPRYFYAPYGPTTDERLHDYEAEDPATTVITDAQALSSTSASNGAYVGGISHPDSAAAFTVTAPQAGSYRIGISYANGGAADATQTVVVNGNTGSPSLADYPSTGASGQFAPGQVVTITVPLNAGSNTVVFQPNSGVADLDKITTNPYFNYQAGGCCHWDGPSWPYATSQTLTGLANLLDNYPAQTYITKNDYVTLLENYATTQHINGHPYVAEAADPDTGAWIYNTSNHSENYNHSTFNDLVLSGLVGVRPRADNTFELKPLTPASWTYFCLENVPYHGHLMTVLWDRDGTHYNQGSGLRIFEDGRQVYQSQTLGNATVDIGAPLLAPLGPLGPRLENIAANPVAADEVAANQPVTRQYPLPFASYTNNGSPGDSPYQAIDGLIYYSDIPNSRWTDYNSPNATDYLGVDFGAPRPVDELTIYTYDDGGSVRAPVSYDVQYWTGDNWVDATSQAKSPATPIGNGPNTVTFDQVMTRKVRVVFTRQSGAYVGVTELEA